MVTEKLSLLAKSDTISSLGACILKIADVDPLDDGLNDTDKAARKTCMKDNVAVVVVAFVTTCACKVDCETVVRDVARNIVFDSVIDDLSSVDSRQR